MVDKAKRMIRRSVHILLLTIWCVSASSQGLKLFSPEMKKAAPKTKPAEKKPAAKKEAAKPVTVEIQFSSGNYSPDEIVEKCKEAYKNGGRKVIRTIEVYVNAAVAKAFYVVNGKNTDKNGNTYSIDL